MSLSRLLGFLKDSNAAANSVDSDIFYRGSDSSTTSCMMTHRWRGVTEDREKKKT